MNESLLLSEYDEKTKRNIELLENNKRAMKRMKLNHEIEHFTLIKGIVRNFLNFINVYKIHVTFPWNMNIINRPDWEFEMLETMLFYGIVGFRCNYLPFYQVEMLTSVNEASYFGYEEDRFFWTSSYLENSELRLPCLYSDGRRPRMPLGPTTSAYWTYNGLLSHLYHEYQLHEALQTDTRTASNTSAAGMYTRTVDMTKLDKSNYMQAVRYKTLNNPTITTEIADGQSEDIKNMLRTADALMDAVDERNPNAKDDDEDLHPKPMRLPPAVVDTVVYPPKILMGAFISYEMNMRQYVTELVINSTDECSMFMRRALQAFYNHFLVPEIFYATYMRLYSAIIDEINDYMSKTKRPSERDMKKRKSVPYFKRQIVEWMRLQRKDSAEHLAFFQTLTPQTYDSFLIEMSTTYEGQTYADMEEDERMQIITAWLEHEFAFCKKEMDKSARRRKEYEKQLKKQQKLKEQEEHPKTDDPKENQLDPNEPSPTDADSPIDFDTITFSWPIIKPELVPTDKQKVNRSNEFINQ